MESQCVKTIEGFEYEKKILAVLIMGMTPAFAVQYGEITQAVDPMAVRGKGAAESAVQVESEQVSKVNSRTLSLRRMTKPVILAIIAAALV